MPEEKQAELESLLAKSDTKKLSQRLQQPHPAMVAEAIEGMAVDQALGVLDHAPDDREAQIFGFLSPEKQSELVDTAGPARISRLLEAMSHDDRVDLLKRLDPKVVEDLLPYVGKEDREDIRRLMAFPEDTAGSVMTTDFAWVPAGATVQDAFARLRRQAPSSETIYYVYVLDEEQRLLGLVSLRSLILAEPTERVGDIMQTDLISARVDEDQETVAIKMGKYDLVAMPVVDDRNRLVGIITHDDVADVLQAEATEDFHLAAAVKPLAAGYGQAGVLHLYRRRIGWLVMLVFINLFSSGIIAAYEETLTAVIALAFFLPLLIDSGGNTGSQAATLIVRALATGEVTLKRWLRIVWKEVAVGFTLGFTMALASFALGVFRGDAHVGLVVGLSMFFIVVLTNLVGTMLPFILTRMRIDPAVASSPLITTVADAMGLLIYFGIATALLVS